jgi:hypothetical protein
MQFFDFARAAASCANALVDARADSAAINIRDRFILILQSWIVPNILSCFATAPRLGHML